MLAPNRSLADAAARILIKAGRIQEIRAALDLVRRRESEAVASLARYLAEPAASHWRIYGPPDCEKVVRECRRHARILQRELKSLEA